MEWYWILLISVAAFLAVVYVVAAFVSFKFSIVRPTPSGGETEERYIKRNERRAKDKERFFSLNPESMEMKSKDGLTLRAWYLPAEKPTNKFVVLIHGYTCNGPDEFGHIYSIYHDELGYNCFLPDHRAHGRSEGKYTGFGALDSRDILAWLDVLIERFGSDIEIMLHGVSMGAATAMLVNESDPPEQVKLVVEDCGFTNAYEQVCNTARGLFKGMNANFLVVGMNLVCKCLAKYSLKEADALGAMKLSKCPILFIHGGSDDFVFTEMVERLYNACEVPKDKLIVPGAVHAFSAYEDPEAYKAKIKEFIAKNSDMATV